MKLDASVASCVEELEQLCQQLCLPPEPALQGSLLVREKQLRSRVDTLNKVR